MPEVAIVVDTTHYMPRELVESNGLHEVSLYVNAGDRHERESDMPDFDAFYESLRTSAQLPTTSQPSIGDFLTVYEPLVEEGRDIVSVHISGGISGTVDSARQAATDLASRKPQRRIEVKWTTDQSRSGGETSGWFGSAPVTPSSRRPSGVLRSPSSGMADSTISP